MGRRRIAVIAALTVGLIAVLGGINASANPSDKAGSAPVAETKATKDADEAAQAADPPETEAPAAPATPTKDHDCGETGKHQREVESVLASLADYGTVFVDGEQSKEDCEAIKKFQKRMGIQPAEGFAGEFTLQVAQRIAKSAFDECDEVAGVKTICVDLTHQTLWVVEDGKRIVEPTVVRTGMAGYATTPGAWRIFDRAPTHWSRPYKVWLPYWQNFNNGQGLHETTTYIHNGWGGSHGCVNLLPRDASKLYELLGNGDVVQVFGHRPGT